MNEAAAPIRLIAGLGNPGREYQRTRHNVGFMVLDRLAADAQLPWDYSEKWGAAWAKSERDPGQAGNFHESQRPAAFRDRKFLQDRGRRKFSSCSTTWRFRSGGCACARRAARVDTTGSNRSSSISAPRRSRGCASGSAPRPRRARSITCSADFLRKNKPMLDAAINRAAEAVKCAIDKGLFAAMNVFNKPPEEL